MSNINSAYFIHIMPQIGGGGGGGGGGGQGPSAPPGFLRLCLVVCTGPAHSVQSWCGQLLNISMGVAACKARARVEVFFRSTCPAHVDEIHVYKL